MSFRHEVAVSGGAAVRPSAAMRVVRVAIGAMVVSAAAQVAVPLPFTPVPVTLQPLAVLAVGGLLGATEGLGALLLYLALGLLGLPVFFAGGAGIGHLLGPTGGYLLAFPIAAAATGAIAAPAGRPSRAVWRVLAGCVTGMLLIHAGGIAQLALVTGDAGSAFRMGFVPFFTGDLIKIGLAAAVILLGASRVRPAA